MSKVNRVIFAGIWLLLTSCIFDAAILNNWSDTLTTQLFYHPLPIPSFLSLPIYSPQPGAVLDTVDEICLELNQSALWEFGVFAEELSIHLINHLSMWVDGKKLPRPPGEEILLVTTLTTITDSSGNLVASYGGPISTCFQVKLEPGQHIVTVQVSNVSGRIYSYSWVFAIAG